MPERSPEDRVRHRQLREQLRAEKPENDRRVLAALESLRRLGETMSRARIDAGLSVDQLADRSGIPAEEISRLESGRVEPTFDTMRRYADALGLELEVRFVEAA